MITEVALITISCVLFIQMGLADAIKDAFHLRITFVCPKCLTYWCCLFWLVIHKNGIVVSVAASFIASYCALWLSLLHASLALLYNYLYEQITETQDTSQDAERPDSYADTQAGGNEVSDM